MEGRVSIGRKTVDSPPDKKASTQESGSEGLKEGGRDEGKGRYKGTGESDHGGPKRLAARRTQASLPPLP